MVDGKPLKCKHCGYRWQYKGKSKYYATCPRCLRKVPVKDLKGQTKLESTKQAEL
jgi:predicted Zn-ribbon and HTH transcriptional regulator